MYDDTSLAALLIDHRDPVLTRKRNKIITRKVREENRKEISVIFGIVVMGAITGTLILTPSLVKAQSIPIGTYETDSKLQVSNMSAAYCDYCRPFKTGFDMLGIIRNTGNTVYDNVSISAQLFDVCRRLIALENISSSHHYPRLR